jgi:hypothetical protein
VISRLKLINIKFGDILESFLKQLSNVFQLSSNDKLSFEYDYKYRHKLTLYNISVLSFMSIWDKYLIYLTICILKSIVQRVLEYAVSINRANTLDQALSKLYMNLLIISLTFIIYDLFLFGSRNMLHQMVYNQDIQTAWSCMNYMLAFVVIQLFI